MTNPEHWSIDDNGYYLTDYSYSPQSNLLISSDDNMVNYTVTFDESTNIEIDFSVGMMGGMDDSELTGLFWSPVYADEDEIYWGDGIPLVTNILGNSSNINEVINNTISLTNYSYSIGGVKELQFFTRNSPVLWIDHITIRNLGDDVPVDNIVPVIPETNIDIGG